MVLERRTRWTPGALRLACAGLLALPLLTLAGEARPNADDPALEARMLHITTELRCLVCQNQTVADSHSGLAQDLRQKVRELLAAGNTDPQVIDYMTARYGDFVLYRPPVKTSTVLLWFGPALLLLAALGALLRVLRQRSRLSPEQFDADDDTADPDATAPAAAQPPPTPDLSKDPVHGH
ncbi:MAG: cytochrome c-type biogenesis protein [Burkholderiales bacterium]